jgi:GTP 3',8-cyclase
MLLPLLPNSAFPSPALSAPSSASSRIGDRHGRTIGYLRLSLTKACQMRCVYCRPDFDRNEPHDQLTAIEIEHLTRHLAARHGVRKVRLTGGDPTARRDLVDVIRRVASVDGIDDLAMTTNGLTLAAQARAYADAGLRRVNVSLDTLDRDAFARLTGVDALDRVVAGIDAAIDAFGARKVKLNAVVVRGQNVDALAALLRYAADRDVELRFIELMPMGPLAAAWADRFVPERDMRDALASEVDHWAKLPETNESARRYVATLHDGREARVGFITPMSCHFCAGCDRLRIGSDGSIYPCLMDAPAANAMAAIRPAFDARRFDELLTRAYDGKRSEHPHDGVATMTHVGG